MSRGANRILIKLIKLIERVFELLNFYYWELCNSDTSRFMISQEIRSSWKFQSGGAISTVVFSKDRAMQLHALLSSFFNSKKGECKVIVIYSFSSLAHEQSYVEVAEIFAGKVEFVKEKNYLNFRDCLEQVVSRLPAGNMFFLVDDIIFTEVIDFEHLICLDLSETIFSLRMGNHLTYSYVVDANQPLPDKLISLDGYLTWLWKEGRWDWGYPLSVDGHIFFTEEVMLWIKYLDFMSPSSFENALQKLKYLYRNKRGMSYAKSKIVNIPVNKVQLEVDNLYGCIHQDDLLRMWFDGLAIDHTKFRGWTNRSVHEEAEFSMIKRC